MDYKLVLYGDYSVGKTSLVTRLLSGSFNSASTSTIGAAFLLWKTKINDTNMSIGIWDTPGQLDKFGSIMPMFLRKADVVFYCYDYNEIFYSTIADNALQKIKEVRDDCHIYLVFTKIDKSNDPVIRKITGEQWIVDNDLHGCFYTSSRTGRGIRSSFQEMAMKLFGKESAVSIIGDTINIDNSNTNDTIQCPTC